MKTVSKEQYLIPPRAGGMARGRFHPVLPTIIISLMLSVVCARPDDRAAHDLLIKWKDGPESSVASAGNQRLGGKVVRSFPEIGWQQVKPRASISIGEALKEYSDLAGVESVEPNLIIIDSRDVENISASPLAEAAVNLSLASAKSSPLATTTVVAPNDPLFSQQWFLKKINATNAWRTSIGNSNVVVAVLDTGINYKHEDLAANMWRNPGEIPGNGIDDDVNGYIDDIHGIDTASDSRGNDSDPLDEGFFNGSQQVYHGTMCAGLIGSVGSNGKGLTGLNWSIQMMAVRSATMDDRNWIADTIAGFEYVLLMRKRGVNIRVTSNSYSTNPRSAYSQALHDALKALEREGVLCVFAAANHGFNIDQVPIYPARDSLRNLLIVASSDRNDAIASDSNFGRTAVHIAAPGVDIVTTSGPGLNNYSTGAHGTSFATPLVAGTAGLLLSVNPTLEIDEMKAAILGSVDPIAALKAKVSSNGRLNVSRALEYLTNANPVPIVISATPRGLRSPLSEAIEVRFNRAMNRASVESAFVVQPSLSGAFQWASDSRSVAFVHDAPFEIATNYTVRILGTGQDELGQTLDGNFNRTLEGAPSDDFVWNIYFGSPNDDFANRTPLIGSTGIVAGNNQFASTELGELFHVQQDDPAHGRTLWYSWSPPAGAGWFTFDLGSGSFDSLLAIFTGDAVSQLTAIGANDNYGTRLASRVNFYAVPDTTYGISVASKSAFAPTQAGAFSLAWYPTPPPGFTGTQFSPSSGAPGARITLTGTNFTGASAVLFNGVPASFTNAPTNNVDLRITAIVPPDATTGPITILTPHGNVTSTSSFQVLRPALNITRTAVDQITLSWFGTTNFLESSQDLRTWEEVATNGSISIEVNPSMDQRFFRLRSP